MASGMPSGIGQNGGMSHILPFAAPQFSTSDSLSHQEAVARDPEQSLLPFSVLSKWLTRHSSNPRRGDSTRK